MTDQVNLYNPHNGLTGRDGGPYLDQEERRLAEIVRAGKEDREPDFENAPATAGTPLVSSSVLVGMANPASNPSQSNTVDAMTNAVDLLADNEKFPATPHSHREKTEEEVEAQRLAESNDPHDNPANPTVISKDSADVSEQTKELAKQDEPTSESKPAAKKTTTAKKTAAKKSTTKSASVKKDTAPAQAPSTSK